MEERTEMDSKEANRLFLESAVISWQCEMRLGLYKVCWDEWFRVLRAILSLHTFLLCIALKTLSSPTRD